MLEFGILGPLEVRAGGAPVAISGRNQRSLLTLLLLRANETVSSERLVNEMWGEQPPKTAGTSLQNAVSQLRKALGPGLLVTKAHRDLVEVAYVGNDSEKLLMGGQSGATVQAGDFANQNKMPVGALFVADPVTGVVAPNPEDVTKDLNGGPLPNKYADYQPFGYAYGTGVITVPTHVGYGNYNALQTSWIKQGGRLTFNLNYTWSKTLGVALQSDPFSVRGNYGVVGIDRPHVINTSFSYNLPTFYNGNKLLKGAVGGWTIASITTWQAGGNLQALYSSQSANLGLALSYTGTTPTGVGSSLGDPTYFGTTAGIAIMPDTTCDPGGGLAANQRAKLTCLALPDIGSNGPRNLPYLSGPSYFNSDLALYKTFNITEKQNVQLRFSAFNWLNHPLPIFSNGSQLQFSHANGQVKPKAVAKTAKLLGAR